jgi:hypothetical protein
MAASAGVLASSNAVEKAEMLIRYRLSLYAFIGAHSRAPPFPGLTFGFDYNARPIGDAPYQQLSPRRN